MTLQAAFEFFTKLGRRVLVLPRPRHRPRGRQPGRDQQAAGQDRRRWPRSCRSDTGVKLLWGTTNAFSHRRFMAGAATNPSPAVFAYAASQVKKAMEVTKRARRRGLRLLGRPRGLRDAAQHRPEARAGPPGACSCRWPSTTRRRSASSGQFYIEPKPKEPTKHQYDFDAATCYAFLQKYGLVERLQAEHRGQPRHAGRPHVPPRAGVLRRQRHPRLGRRQPRRPAARLGHRPVPDRHLRHHAGDVHDPQGRRVHHRRPELRRQGPAAVDRPGGPVPRPHRRDGRLRPRPEDRRAR